MPIDRPGDKFKNKAGIDREQGDYLGSVGPDRKRGIWGNQQYVEGEQRIGAIDGGAIFKPVREGIDIQRDALERAESGQGMGQLQLRQGLGSAAMQQAAMGAGGGPMAQRAAMMAGAQQASQGVGQAAMVRQQEMAAARAGLAQGLQAGTAAGVQYNALNLQRDQAQAQHHQAMAQEARLQQEMSDQAAAGTASTIMAGIGTAAMLMSDPKLKGAYSPGYAKDGFYEGRAIGEGNAPSPTSNAVRDADVDDALSMMEDFDRQDATPGGFATDMTGFRDTLENYTSSQDRALSAQNLAANEERKMREGRARYPEESSREAEARLTSEARAIGSNRAAQEAYVRELAHKPPSFREEDVAARSGGSAWLKPGTLSKEIEKLKPMQAAKKTAEVVATRSEKGGDNPYDLSGSVVGMGKGLMAASDPKLKKGRKKRAKAPDAHPEGSYFIAGAESQGFAPRFMQGTAKSSGLKPDEHYLSKNVESLAPREASAGMLPDSRLARNADRTMSDLDTYHYEYKPEYQKRLGLPAGHRIGVMADELEDTPLGEAAVKDTEEGKVIDRDNYLFGVVTPGLARLHERLEALEKKKGRK